jgi:hypothetical protein
MTTESGMHTPRNSVQPTVPCAAAHADRGQARTVSRTLTDVDTSVLNQIVAGSIAEFRQRYG